MKTSFKYLLFVSIFALLGFSREFIFVNINSQLYALYYHHSDFILPKSLFFLSDIRYNTLYYIKYPLTVFYFLAYYFTSFFAVKFISNGEKKTFWVFYIYLILLVLSSVSMTFGYIMNNQLDGYSYTFSRWLMGIAQSPLVVFFVIASQKLYNKR